MNAAQVIDQFDRICEAPDAIPRLRRFILDLAVRGKLVDHDPAESVDTSIRQIRPQVTSINDPGTWRWTEFGEIATISGGFAFKSADYVTSGTFILRVTNIEPTGVITKTDAVFLPKEKITKEIERFYLSTDDILLVMVGGSLGKLGVVTPEVLPALLNQNLWRITPVADRVDRRFLRLLIDFIVSFQRKITHSTHGHLSREEFRKHQILLPPRTEQHRIVAKVDELMALCDRLEAAQAERESRRDKLAAASLHRLNNGANAEEFREYARFHIHHLPRLTTRPEHIQQLRQTILNLAVRGKLVPQDPNDEPAVALLRRIQAEQVQLLKKGTIKRAHPTFSIDTTQIPSAAPHGWEWVKLGDLLLGDSQNGYSKKPDDAADGIPLLRISAGTLRKDGIVAEEEHKLIGGVSKAQKEQYELQPGDVLACRFNGNRNFVGRLSLYLGYLGIKPIYPDKLIRLRLLSQFVLPKLVRCFAESNMVRQEIEAYCATTVGNWGISASNLKEVKIPLPPLAEQHRIVAKVEELLGLCDRLEAQLITTQTENRRLLEAIIHEALNSKSGL